VKIIAKVLWATFICETKGFFVQLDLVVISV